MVSVFSLYVYLSVSLWTLQHGLDPEPLHDSRDHSNNSNTVVSNTPRNCALQQPSVLAGCPSQCIIVTSAECREEPSPAFLGSSKKGCAAKSEQAWDQVEPPIHDLSFLFCPQTLQMGIKHFSGLFMLLCIGFGLSILTTIGEHIVYRLLLPRIKNKSRLQYWLHTSQVSATRHLPPIFLSVRIPNNGRIQGLKSE